MLKIMLLSYIILKGHIGILRIRVNSYWSDAKLKNAPVPFAQDNNLSQARYGM